MDEKGSESSGDRRPLALKVTALAAGTPPIAGEAAVGTLHPATSSDEGNGVAGTRLRHLLRGRWRRDGAGYLAVGASLTVRDVA